VEGVVDGRRYRVGRPDFVEALCVGGDTGPSPAETPGATVVALGDELGLLARFELADALRPDAAETIRALHELGIEVWLLSGDAEVAVARTARELGIEVARSRMRPDDKLAAVKALQADGAVVAMVGDGVNDAPALAQADVGMAIGSGTDVAKETGDVILIKDDIRDVVVALEVARATMRKVKQNLFWAFFYNTLSIPLAAGLLYPSTSLIISPELAGLLMAVSSITVTLNTLLLKGFNPSIRRGDRPQRGAGKPESRLTPVSASGD